jgi:hypothetical protein
LVSVEDEDEATETTEMTELAVADVIVVDFVSRDNILLSLAGLMEPTATFLVSLTAPVLALDRAGDEVMDEASDLVEVEDRGEPSESSSRNWSLRIQKS